MILHILQVRDLIYTAINDILEVDGLRCPQDKLGSVVSCSKKVFEVLQVHQKSSIVFPNLIINQNTGRRKSTGLR